MNSLLINENGYVHATELCKKGRKLFGDYNRLRQTKIYFNKLSECLDIPVNSLVKIIQGGNPKLQGTWVHPYVATHLAQWISADFSVKVTIWIDEWKQQKNNTQIYNEELKNIIADEKQDDTEKQIQLRLQQELGGKIEVETESGFIDLLTGTELIEIKVGKNWKHGVGQLIIYSHYYPDHQRRLHLFDIETDEMINKLCGDNSIIVTYE